LTLPLPVEDVPPDEHGASLLVPPEEAERWRRRRERPAEVGRFALLGLGLTCIAAGLALWITARGEVGVGSMFVGFGLALAALGGTLHLLLQRDRDLRPERAHAWEDGIELVLHDGDLRAVAWSDPKLALDVFVRPRRGTADEERLLVWRVGRSVPPADLSEAGLARLLEVVATHDLRLAEFRNGRRAREARAYEIRARLPAPTVDGPMSRSDLSGTVP